MPTREFQRHGFGQERATATPTAEMDRNGEGVVAP